MEHIDSALKTDKHRFRAILIQSPANNPPYVSGAGITALFVLTALIIGAFAAGLLGAADIAIMLSAAASGTAMTVAADYAAHILTWRAARIKRLRIQLDTPKHPAVCGSEFKLQCRFVNDLPWSVLIEAVEFDTTQQLDIDDLFEIPSCLPNKSSFYIEFTAHSRDIGPAAVIGLGIAIKSPFGLFRAEFHLEQNTPIDIIPSFAASPAVCSPGIAESIRKMQNRCGRISGLSDFDGIRPFRSGDRMKRILWRGYARHRELIVRHERPEALRHLVCLVDAGPHMRVPFQNCVFRCALVRAAEIIAQNARGFDLVTIISYNENSARTVAEHMSCDAAVGRLTEWLTDAVAWTLPRDDQIDRKTWAEFGSRLVDDYKTYKHVDFSENSSKGKVINFAALAAWTRAEWAGNALRRSDSETAAQFMQMPHMAVLRKLSRERRRWPRRRLNAQPPDPQIRFAEAAIDKALKDDAPALLWISDFAVPVDRRMIEKLNNYAAQGHIPAAAAILPPPIQSLNYIKPRGAACIKANAHRMTAFDLIADCDPDLTR